MRRPEAETTLAHDPRHHCVALARSGIVSGNEGVVWCSAKEAKRGVCNGVYAERGAQVA